MTKRSDGFPATTLVTALAIVWAVGDRCRRRTPPTGSADRATAAPSPARAAPAPAAPAAAQATGFVGDDTCTTCHEPEGKALHATLHGKAQNTRTPAAKTGQSCETCHGPGQAHVDTGDKTKIKRFTAMSAKDVNATCLTCHSKGSHADWNGGMHDARNVSCASCHSVHNPKSERAQLKTVTAVADLRDLPQAGGDEGQEVGPHAGARRQDGLHHLPHARTARPTCACSRSATRSTRRARAATPRSAGRSCTITPPAARTARAATTRTARTTTACSSPRMPMLCQRCHVSSRHPATIYDGTQIAARSNRAVGRSCVQLPLADSRVEPPRGREVPSVSAGGRDAHQTD